jgi:CubicO group peptidase (beta-lactamase class C family)
MESGQTWVDNPGTGTAPGDESAEQTMSSTWRLDPEVEPESVGVDSGKLDEIERRFRSGIEKGDLCAGAQMAVYRRGKRVLDIGGGTARRRTGEAVRPDTMFVIFSSTKGLAALAMLMLYERMKFHYDEPVMKYWPEFASQVPEKASITIRQVMGHRGGFPNGPSWLTARYWPDREAIRRAMVEVPLVWTPGEKNGYHAMNFGHVVNELIERIDGRDCGQFLSQEVFAPLGLHDLYLGLPADEALEARVAWVENPQQPVTAGQATGVAGGAAATGTGPDITGGAPLTSPQSDAHKDTPELSEPFNRVAVWRAVLPAAGGIGTARDLAKVYAALAMGGEMDGVKLVSEEGLRHCTTPTSRPGEIDQTIRLPMRWGTGWHMGGYGEGSTMRTFGHGGRGGQVGFADPDRQLAVAFTTTGQLKAVEYNLWRGELQSLAFAACIR